ncbi:MAG: type I methionyl aminopeptidase [Clostridia bacterium]
MINLKSPSEIELMRQAGKLLRDLLLYLEDKVKPGITTKKLDEFAYDFIKSHGASPSFLGYGGFPGSICASIDEVVVHGIPSSRRLQEGEIIGIDAGLILNGWQSDAARTILVGEVSEEKRKLVEVTKESFFEGVSQFKLGGRLGDISNAIQGYTESRGYSVVRAMVGHGIGREMHEDPSVPNYGRAGHGIKLETGLVLAIEPMINIGTWEVETLKDNWTCVTLDRKPSAHYENTVALTENGIEILTL